MLFTCHIVHKYALIIFRSGGGGGAGLGATGATPKESVFFFRSSGGGTGLGETGLRRRVSVFIFFVLSQPCP